jgi:hypothetical protein
MFIKVEGGLQTGEEFKQGMTWGSLVRSFVLLNNLGTTIHLSI